MAGFENGGESNSQVTRSTFVKNAIGAETGYIYPLTISDSVFLSNDVGVQANPCTGDRDAQPVREEPGGRPGDR